MAVSTTLRKLDFDDALRLVDQGAAFVDLRPTAEYLDVHVPGAISLVYEAGPGMNTRARDCIPLDVPLVLIDEGDADVVHAAASLRGKGFTVEGSVTDAVNGWIATGGRAASTEVISGKQTPDGVILDVADPGARAPEDAVRVPVETLWKQAEDLGDNSRIVVVAGYGVRAGLAIGILERAGARQITFWKTRP